MRGTAVAAAGELTVRTSEPPRFNLLARIRAVMGAREILANLVRKEIKVRYKSSVLGAVWSMLNPIMYLAVFSIVFSLIQRGKLPHFPVYLLSGLLAWSLFSSSVSSGARSVVDNAALVTKVYFPREILPFASVGTGLVDFVITGVVLLGFMLLTHSFVAGWNLLLLPLAMLALLTFTSALGMWVASLNVRYRDTQHLLNLILLTWFWMTPVVYPSALVLQEFGPRHLFGISAFHLYMANPLAGIVMGFQRALYGVVSPDGNPVLLPVSVPWLAMVLGAIALGSLLMLVLAWRTFFHLSGDFGEEL